MIAQYLAELALALQTLTTVLAVRNDRRETRRDRDRRGGPEGQGPRDGRDGG